MTEKSIGFYGYMGVADSLRTNRINQAKRVRICRQEIVYYTRMPHSVVKYGGDISCKRGAKETNTGRVGCART